MWRASRRARASASRLYWKLALRRRWQRQRVGSLDPPLFEGLGFREIIARRSLNGWVRYIMKGLCASGTGLAGGRQPESPNLFPLSFLSSSGNDLAPKGGQRPVTLYLGGKAVSKRALSLCWVEGCSGRRELSGCVRKGSEQAPVAIGTGVLGRDNLLCSHNLACSLYSVSFWTRLLYTRWA